MNPPLPAVLVTAFFVCSCSVQKPQPSSNQTDSVRVEYRERLVIDTVSVIVPKEIERIVTRDTSSHLENEYAKSDASVSEGFLSHTLESKPQTIRVPVTVTVHDTVVVERSAETVVETVEVEREPTFWEQLFFRLGILFVVLAALQIGYFVIKLVCHR